MGICTSSQKQKNSIAQEIEQSKPQSEAAASSDVGADHDTVATVDVATITQSTTNNPEDAKTDDNEANNNQDQPDTVQKLLMNIKLLSDPISKNKSSDKTDEQKAETKIEGEPAAPVEHIPSEIVSQLIKTTHNTFVELLLINRILFGTGKNEADISISDIMSNFGKKDSNESSSGVELNDEDKKACERILTNLFQHKILKFLKDDYNDRDCNVIDLILTQLVIKYHITEYENEISVSLNDNYNYSNSNDDNYNKENKENSDNFEENENMNEKENKNDDDVNNKQSNNNNNKFECMVFNQRDLVPRIFQYLNVQSLNNCSCVNFIWLYHAFNINSLYYLEFYKLLKYENNGNILNLRIWQRFINARSIRYENSKIRPDDEDRMAASKQFLTNFGCLQNLSDVICMMRYFGLSDLSFLQIMSKRTRKIKSLNLVLYGSERNISSKLIHQLPKLRLLGAHTIRLHCLPIPFVCTNECSKLSITRLTMGYAMYNSIINDCDLTGVKELYISDIGIDVRTRAEIKSDKEKAKKEKEAKKLQQSQQTNAFGLIRPPVWPDLDSSESSSSSDVMDDDINVNSIYSINDNGNGKDNDNGGINSINADSSGNGNNIINDGNAKEKKVDIDDIGIQTAKISVEDRIRNEIEIEQEKRHVCQLIAKKFINLKEIKMAGPMENTLDFVQELKPILIENNTTMAVQFDTGHISHKKNKNEILSKHQETITFIVENQLKVTDLKLNIDPFSFELSQTALKTKPVCDNIQVLRLTSYGSSFIHSEGYNRDFCAFVNNIEKNLKNGSINFANLKCMNCYFIFGKSRHWASFIKFFKLKFNNIDSDSDSNNQNEDDEKEENTDKKSDENQINKEKEKQTWSQPFWRINLNMGWPDGDDSHAVPIHHRKTEKEQINEVLSCSKQLFEIVNQTFVQKRIPIDFSISLYRYRWRWQLDNTDDVRAAEKSAKEMQQLYDNEYKPSFIKHFGRFPIAVGLEDDNTTKKILEPQVVESGNGDSDGGNGVGYQAPICNKFCEPLDAPEIECRFEKKDMKSGGDVCEFEFHVKTANVADT